MAVVLSGAFRKVLRLSLGSGHSVKFKDIWGLFPENALSNSMAGAIIKVHSKQQQSKWFCGVSALTAKRQTRHAEFDRLKKNKSGLEVSKPSKAKWKSTQRCL